MSVALFFSDDIPRDIRLHLDLVHTANEGAERVACLNHLFGYVVKNESQISRFPKIWGTMKATLDSLHKEGWDDAPKYKELLCPSDPRDTSFTELFRPTRKPMPASDIKRISERIRDQTPLHANPLKYVDYLVRYHHWQILFQYLAEGYRGEFTNSHYLSARRILETITFARSRRIQRSNPWYRACVLLLIARGADLPNDCTPKFPFSAVFSFHLTPYHIQLLTQTRCAFDRYSSLGKFLLANLERVKEAEKARTEGLIKHTPLCADLIQMIATH
jgi:hypothetical protein